MSKQLCIGLLHLSPEWTALMDQLGLWYHEVNFSLDLSTHYSVIIINDQTNREQLAKLESYVKAGGAILEVSAFHPFTPAGEIRKSYQKTVYRNTEDTAFTHLPYLDLYNKVGLHKQSGIFEGLVHFQNKKDGQLAYFGANIAELMQDTEYKRKRFYSAEHTPPDEIVSQVSKHTLAGLFEAVLKELHFKQGLPLVQKWISPTQKPVFGFRIDSDFGDMESIEGLYEVLKRYQIKATWFLHVQAHENWLDYFHQFDNQEIALHGYRHGTSKHSSKVLQNLSHGKELLEEAGYGLTGFCAPYGIYNEALQKALENFDFSYSSEFTFAYDGLPIQITAQKQPIQIPIHPICTGSMRRRRYTPNQMSAYFLQVMARKAARFEPVFLYHHPLQPGLHTLEPVFQKVQDANFENLTFDEYARFWKKRRETHFEAHWDKGKVHIEKNNNCHMLFQVSFSHQGFSLLEGSGQAITPQKSPKFEYSKAYLPEPKQIAEMRTKDLKLMKTSLLDWKNRIRL
ncbi:polysaccharide deacetylase family protein [Gracilimonas mengyeensis]|uniref:Peptidoglycan/xylan/chitin deacetylase, PgdA/CDA1 family n=1 Tax=Gracilimonas mengyeensis TaxID=1302730 RepID=A0A521AGS2_9BACT|nr:polysaccharide deacetylase family protein [Gracilimonas mengyeensis]SMO33973.1 Peptidoglycan/xylan/chitin deacetylase, PgdA/CDA1 family [Gracilimonas mengyeensis]